MKAKTFELSNGHVLVVPDAIPWWTVAPDVVYGEDAERCVERMRAHARALEDTAKHVVDDFEREWERRKP